LGQRARRRGGLVKPRHFFGQGCASAVNTLAREPVLKRARQAAFLEILSGPVSRRPPPRHRILSRAAPAWRLENGLCFCF
jgi:hypothetical protein